MFNKSVQSYLYPFVVCIGMISVAQAKTQVLAELVQAPHIEDPIERKLKLYTDGKAFLSEKGRHEVLVARLAPLSLATFHKASQNIPDEAMEEIGGEECADGNNLRYFLSSPNEDLIEFAASINCIEKEIPGFDGGAVKDSLWGLLRMTGKGG